MLAPLRSRASSRASRPDSFGRSDGDDSWDTEAEACLHGGLGGGWRGSWAEGGKGARGMAKPWASTSAWKPVSLPAVEKLLNSNQTFELDRRHWPAWAQDSTQMERLWLYCPDEENSLTIPGSTSRAIARLLTERYDSKDSRPFNYNFYLISQTTDGTLFQSRPIRTEDPPHHSTNPPSWLEAYGPPPPGFYR